MYALRFPIEDRTDASIDNLGAVAEGGSVTQSLEQVKVSVAGELRDFADSLGRRLHILRERDCVNGAAILGRIALES